MQARPTPHAGLLLLVSSQKEWDIYFCPVYDHSNLPITYTIATEMTEEGTNLTPTSHGV